MQRDEAHIAFLDHIRGFAILSVFVYHCFGAAFHFSKLNWNGWFPDFHTRGSFLALPFTFGWAGVPIFFVVSGFCIHLSHRRSSRKDMATFFTRRFFRIYLPYLVALLIFIYRDYVHVKHIDGFAQMGSHFFLFRTFTRSGSG